MAELLKTNGNTESTTVSPKWERLEILFNEILCSNSENRWYGHWKYRYKEPLNFIQYKKDDNGHFISKGIINRKNKEYVPFFTTMYATKSRTNETGEDYYKNDVYFDNIIIDLDDHDNYKEAIKQGYNLGKWFKHNEIDVLIYYTGNKGVHCLTPFNTLNIKNIQYVKREFTDSLKEAKTDGEYLGKPNEDGEIQPIDTIDDQVKNTLGLRSLPFARHRTTKNYSLFLDLNKTLEENLQYIEDHKQDNPLEAISNNEDWVYVPPLPNLERNTELLEPKLKHLDFMGKLEANTPSYFKDDLKYVDVSKLKTTELKDNLKKLCVEFRKLHTKGHRMEIAWRLMHMMRRAEYPINEVKDFFINLDKQTYIENNYEYEINRAYRLNPNTSDKLGGMTALLDGVEKYAPLEEVDYLINYFGGFFKTKAEKLQMLQMGDDKCNASLRKDYSTNYLTYHKVFDQYDIELDLKLNKLYIRDNKTNKGIGTLKFKYDNNYFDISKTNINDLNELLRSLNYTELPNLLPFYIRQHMEENKIKANTTEIETSNWENNEESKLKNLFEKRTNKELARKELGNYMNQELGIALKYKTHEPLILDKATNSYETIELDDILSLISNNNILEKNSIHTDDVKNALGFISDRKKPQYNYIKCGNGLFNLNTWELEDKSDKPILTVKQTKYNYNPNAKPDDNLKNYLKTSFKAKPTGDKEKDKKNLENNIQSLFEIIGGSFLIGNPTQVIYIIIGQSGGGKGVASDLIEELHGKDKVSNIALQHLTTENKHATSDLIGKQVNITRDITNAVVRESGIIKNVAGGDPIDAEPKGKQRVKIPSEEVPILIIVCNNMPKFEGGLDHTVLTKLVILEIYAEIRGTDQQILNLANIITDNSENMEYLLYKGLEAIKPIVKDNKNYKGKIDELTTMEILGKHTDPVTFLLKKLVKECEHREDDDKITYNEIVEVLKESSKKEGVNLPYDNNKVPARKIMAVLKSEIIQDEHYDSAPERLEGKTQRYYPNLQKTVYFTTIQEIINAKKKKE